MQDAVNSSATPMLRDYEQAAAVCHGASRLLHALGFAAMAELPLASGRRADLIALGGSLFVVAQHGGRG